LHPFVHPFTTVPSSAILHGQIHSKRRKNSMLHGRRHPPPPKKKRAQLHEEDALERFYELVISSPD
jgi:hypothetical protein